MTTFLHNDNLSKQIYMTFPSFDTACFTVCDARFAKSFERQRRTLYFIVYSCDVWYFKLPDSNITLSVGNKVGEQGQNCPQNLWWLWSFANIVTIGSLTIFTAVHLFFIHCCRDNLPPCNVSAVTLQTVNIFVDSNIRLRKAKFFVESNDAVKDFYIVKNCYLSMGQDRLNPHTLKFSLCGTNETITDSQLFVCTYFFLPKMLFHFFMPVNP